MDTQCDKSSPGARAPDKAPSWNGSLVATPHASVLSRGQSMSTPSPVSTVVPQRISSHSASDTKEFAVRECRKHHEVIDLQDDHEVIDLQDEPEVIDLQDDQEIIDLQDSEDIIDLQDDEEIVDLKLDDARTSTCPFDDEIEVVERPTSESVPVSVVSTPLDNSSDAHVETSSDPASTPVKVQNPVPSPSSFEAVEIFSSKQRRTVTVRDDSSSPSQEAIPDPAPSSTRISPLKREARDTSLSVASACTRSSKRVKSMALAISCSSIQELTPDSAPSSSACVITPVKIKSEALTGIRTSPLRKARAISSSSSPSTRPDAARLSSRRSVAVQVKTETLPLLDSVETHSSKPRKARKYSDLTQDTIPEYAPPSRVACSETRSSKRLKASILTGSVKIKMETAVKIKMEAGGRVKTGHKRETSAKIKSEASAKIKRKTDGKIKAESDRKVKAEADLHRRAIQTERLWPNHVLLARQDKNGIMKLGGGNCTMELYPTMETHPRFEEIGNRQAMCYSEAWQPFGPKYAGANGAVRFVPVENEPFSLFMQRTYKGTTIGWEYCGEYISDLSDDFVGRPFFQAKDMRWKQKQLKDMQRSLATPDGKYQKGIDRWRDILTDALKKDKSVAPKWWVGGRERSETEHLLENPSLAARARALGFYATVSTHRLAEIVVNLDEYHIWTPVRFSHYDETIYNYVKEGATTRNAQCKLRERNEPPALASDWYAILDSQVTGSA